MNLTNERQEVHQTQPNYHRKGFYYRLTLAFPVDPAGKQYWFTSQCTTPKAFANRSPGLECNTTLQLANAFFDECRER